jgi:hypothetical protein
MTKPKKQADPNPGAACSPTVEDHKAAMAQLQGIYEDHLNTSMGHLHNRFVGFIAESRLPIPQVLLVLKMLVDETIDQAKKKYLGG